MRLPDPHAFRRRAKPAFFLLLDASLVPVCLFLASTLRSGTLPLDALNPDDLVLLGVVTLGALALSWLLRLNQIRLRVLAVRSVLRLALGAVLVAVLAMAASYALAQSAPRSVPIIFGVLYFFGLLGLRMGLAGAVAALETRRNPAVRVAIYGAGSAGLQLASGLGATRAIRPCFFIDDNPALHGAMLAGLPVHAPDRIDAMARRHNVRRIILAMPGIDFVRQAVLTQGLTARGFEVQVLPSYRDLMSGLGAQTAIRPVDADELFGRTTVAINRPEVHDAYAGRVVMVTGAGGRIGSELCRQVLQCKPQRLVLLDQNETALMAVTDGLRPAAEAAGVALSARLGNVTHRAGIAAVLRDERVAVVFHAAAYRNVPLVEANELESTRNNVLGAQVMAETAEAAGVERFVLVSSNKTPQSDSLVSATRSMAELVVQDLAVRARKTGFTVVRMANVLGQKGALLPLMQRQIQAGGPVTIAHPDTARVFATVTETARLVLIAGAMARGGDVFLLDAGKPRNVADIARQLIQRSGRSLRDPVTGVGDIEIRFTGLRPGEKLCDDVPADDPMLHPTAHPQIMRVNAPRLSQIQVAAMLRELAQALETGDSGRLRTLVATRIAGQLAGQIAGQPDADRSMAQA